MYNFILSMTTSLQDHFATKIHQNRPDLMQTVTSQAHSALS